MEVWLQQMDVETVGLCEQALLTAVHSKFGCTAILHGVTARRDTNFAKKPKVTPEERYSTTLPSGLKISVWKDDLTVHQVDAVVNAANEDLDHMGGLAYALSKAGGPSIQQESDMLIRQQGKVPTGQAVVTSAGNLPCKKLIHAVGPYVSRGASGRDISDASKYLEKVIDNILSKVESENLSSVAIPAISSGLFNFPLPLCADIIVARLKKYHNDPYKRKTIGEIRLVNNDEPSVSEMTRACRQVFETPKSYSATVSGKASSTSSVTLNRVTLRVIKGHIEKQKTTAIVNTSNPTLDLSNGAISKAILKEAGQKLQSEVYSTHRSYNSSSGYGDVVKTKGWNLSAKWVYHVICQHKLTGANANQSLQMLRRVVSECLIRAAKDQCTSIAFPAIGSGELGFSRSEVAEIMTRAVRDFSKTHRSSMEVYFVIYPLEDATFQAFMKEFEALRTSSSHSSISYNEPLPYEVKASQAPYIELRSSEEVQRTAANRWICDILNIQRLAKTQHRIRNNHIQHFGLQEHNELLSLQTVFSVGLKVCYTVDDQASITVTGSPSNVTAAVLQVEAMCCKVQEAYAKAVEDAMLYSIVRWVCKDFPQMESPEINATVERAYLAGKDAEDLDSYIRVDFKSMEIRSPKMICRMERKCSFKNYRAVPGLPGNSYFHRTLGDSNKNLMFKDAGLDVNHVEKVENQALEELFELTRNRISGSPKTLYQRVPAQFCRFISWVGFQREYSPPDDQAYGQGIYFTNSVKLAMSQWKGMEEEEYVYIIEAAVLTGSDTLGSRDLIVPPSKTAEDTLVRYDSLKGGTGIHVIFNGHQALPRFIYTLKKT